MALRLSQLLVGVVFAWSLPYGVALWHPIRHRLAMLETLVMQAIGVVGVSWIYAKMPAVEHAVARQSLARFMAFDALGLAALVLATWISRKS